MKPFSQKNAKMEVLSKFGLVALQESLKRHLYLHFWKRFYLRKSFFTAMKKRLVQLLLINRILYHTNKTKCILIYDCEKRPYNTIKSHTKPQGQARSFKATDGRKNIKQWFVHFQLATFCSIWSNFHCEHFFSFLNIFFEPIFFMIPNKASFRTFEHSSRSKRMFF